MIHVFIDTTEFRNDPLRRKAGFTALVRLARRKKVSIHTSDVVRREFISQQLDHVDKAINAIEKGIKALHVKVPVPKLTEGLNRELELLRQNRQDAELEADNWLQTAPVQIHEVKPHHGAAVLEKYFEGRQPFRAAKFREDFPDGFVWEAIRDIIETTGHLHVVTHDGMATPDGTESASLTVHRSLDDFLKDPSVAPLMAHSERFDAAIKGISDSARNVEYFVERMLMNELSGSSYPFLLDNANCTIRDVIDVSSLRLHLQQADDFGDGIIVVPFSADAECAVRFLIGKEDFQSQFENFKSYVATDWNHRYYKVEMSTVLVLGGKVAFQIVVGAGTEEVSVKVLGIETIDTISFQDDKIKDAFRFVCRFS